MKRRDNIKLLLAGGLGTTLLLSDSCKPHVDEQKSLVANMPGPYGRTEEEIKHDEKVLSETFFTKEELTVVSLLADIIIPKDEVSGSATEAGVPQFIEFMMKDQPDQQLSMRGGLKWLDHQCSASFGKIFAACSEEQRLAIIDKIAFPDKASPEMKAGVKFFNLMRNLVATGFYTSQMGITDIGYKGNVPNEWNGVPDEVLKKHGFEYDPKYIDVYVKPEDRGNIMTWTD